MVEFAELPVAEDVVVERDTFVEDPRMFYYFAYGSNMNPEQIQKRGVKPRHILPARLPGHELAFFGHTRVWDGAMESVVPSPGDVWGIIYEISFSAREVLDSWQDARLDGTGVYFHYPTEVIDVNGKSHPVVLYKKDLLGERTLPSQEYLDFILAGAIQHGLPCRYIDKVRDITTRKAGYPVPLRSKFDFGQLASMDCSQCGG
jgi:hypothetical protein